jgi:glycine dehydrogenase subunit 1
MFYTPHTPQDVQKMLETIGVKSVEKLFDSVPKELRAKKKLKLPKTLSEQEAAALVKGLAGENLSSGAAAWFLGAGVYNHYIPAVVDHLAGRSEFYTAYTPYQPEASQGTLQAIFEYQTMMCELTGLDVCNASMYDGSTALVEAALMSMAIKERRKVVVSGAIHPEYRQVVQSYLSDLSAELIEIDVDAQTACVALQSPNFFGIVEDCDAVSQAAHGAGALMISVSNPISLALLKPPAAYGADIAVGEGQPLGIPMSYGGPHLGIFVVKKDFLRKMPGRIVGQTADTEGKRGFVLTLSTREQHIRREKATSNICSNEALCALRATIYLTAMGKCGLKQVANLCLQNAHYAAEKIAAVRGYSLSYKGPFFNEFVVKCPKPAKDVFAELMKKKVVAGLPLSRFFPQRTNELLICTTELTSKKDIDRLCRYLPVA